MDADQNVQDIATAARTLGLTPDAVRKRLARGSLTGGKGSDGKWWVRVDTDHDATGQRPESVQNGHGENDATVQNILDALRSELDAKNQQIEQLHVLLQQAQQLALPAPKDSRSWWRFWRRGIGG